MTDSAPSRNDSPEQGTPCRRFRQRRRRSRPRNAATAPSRFRSMFGICCGTKAYRSREPQNIVILRGLKAIGLAIEDEDLIDPRKLRSTYPVDSAAAHLLWWGQEEPKDAPSRLPEDPCRVPGAFATEDACRRYLMESRWPNGYRCPRCGHAGAYQVAGRGLLQCRACRYQVSATAGTVMHRTRVPLRDWFWAAYLVTTHTPCQGSSETPPA